MNILDLNGDVLFAIISSMDKEAVKSFSITCRRARDEAIWLVCQIRISEVRRFKELATLPLGD
jgi:hypothetical protein